MQRELLAPRQLLLREPGSDRRCRLAGGAGWPSAHLHGQGEADRLSCTTSLLDHVDRAEAARARRPPAATSDLGRRRAGGDPDRRGVRRARSRSSSVLVLDEVRGQPLASATSTSRFEFDELREPTTSTRSHSAARIARPPPGGSAWRSRCRRRRGRERAGSASRSASTTVAASRRRRAWSGSGRRRGRGRDVCSAGRRRRDRSTTLDRLGRLADACPRPPRGRRGRPGRSGSPSRANRRASAWTLATSGQVASITRSRALVRPRSWTAGATPWAASTTVRAVGHLVELVDEERPRASRSARRGCCGRSGGARRPAGRSVERALDDVDRPLDAGAERARTGEQDRAPARSVAGHRAAPVGASGPWTNRPSAITGKTSRYRW